LLACTTLQFEPAETKHGHARAQKSTSHSQSKQRPHRAWRAQRAQWNQRREQEDSLRRHRARLYRADCGTAAFEHAKRNSVLAALVSGDPQKLKVLGRRYGVTNLCSYEEVDQLFASGDIHAVYIATPNTLHKEYAIRAANAGLHVLVEKPMAISAEDCEEMTCPRPFPC
jgi:hypothetical protein